MTLIVTHTAGFLACFTRNPDGSMKQRALIDTGEEPPTAAELATMGDQFARQYGWIEIQPLPTRNKIKALPSSSDETRKLKDAERQRRNRAKKKIERDNDDSLPIEQRKAMIVDYLSTHPDSILPEVLEGLGLEPTMSRRARWHHHFGALVAAGTIIVVGQRANNKGHPKEYQVA